jgi:hypothetical protein
MHDDTTADAMPLYMIQSCMQLDAVVDAHSCQHEATRLSSGCRLVMRCCRAIGLLAPASMFHHRWHSKDAAIQTVGLYGEEFGDDSYAKVRRGARL